MQQILAFETDLLEYDDLFDGNPAIERKVGALKEGALAELALIDKMGGAVKAIEYMKMRLVEANAERIAGIESGATTVVGVNPLTTSEPTPQRMNTRSVWRTHD
jgi:(2R)-ethylmalonyl-CoA mutase